MYFRDFNTQHAVHTITGKSVSFPYTTTLTLAGDIQQLFLPGITLSLTLSLARTASLSHAPCLALSFPLSPLHVPLGAFQASPLHSSNINPSLLSLTPSPSLPPPLLPASSLPSFRCILSPPPHLAPTALPALTLALSPPCPCFLVPSFCLPTPTLIRHSLMTALRFESC